jgi:glycosyltransferase involved in cell wall biosynthesis
MKILMLAPLPLPGDSAKGGVESVTQNLLEGFSKINDLSIIVLSVHKNLSDELELQLYDNVIVKHIPYKIVRSTKIVYGIYVKRVVYKYFKEFKADLIHIQGNGTELLAFKSNHKNRIVVTQHGILHEEIKHVKDFIGKMNLTLSIMIENYYKKRIQNWIGISKYNLEVAKSRNYKLDKYIHIFNPVASKFFLTERLEIIHRASLYYVGSISRRKGLCDLLNAIVILRKKNIILTLKVFGGFVERRYQNEIESYIYSNGLESQVEFFGWRKADEIINLTTDASILVLPSYQETLPVVIAEAMAMGKIVVSTNICGIPEMVKDRESGFLYQKGNIRQLTEILVHLATSKSINLNEISINARNYATLYFSPNAVAQQTVCFYKYLIDYSLNSGSEI